MARFNLLASDIIDLQLKLNGKIPINLANSWGRNKVFYTLDKAGNEIKIEKKEIKEKYNLSKLDVSQITNFDSIFRYSNFNGDINSWDVSNAILMEGMFFCAKEFNQPLDKWNTSKVLSMYCMFYNSSSFNQNLNSWNISKVININGIFSYTEKFNQLVLWNLSNIKYCSSMFYEANAFENRFNKGKELLRDINGIKEWLIDNRDKMIAIDIKDNKSKELDNFLLNLNVIDSTNLNELHDNKELCNGII